MKKNRKLPYDQRLARWLLKPLSGSLITPNQITSLTLLFALIAAILFAKGDEAYNHWAAGLFVLARFFDHFDGELARLKGTVSDFGYYFDYIAGGLSYAALFVGLGVGQAQGELGVWAIVLGFIGASAAIISLYSNLGIDRLSNALSSGEAVGYPIFGGFELEDGIYLIAPITWLGLLAQFFVVAGIGATVYCLWSMWRFARLITQKTAKFEKKEDGKKR